MVGVTDFQLISFNAFFVLRLPKEFSRSPEEENKIKGEKNSSTTSLKIWLKRQKSMRSKSWLGLKLNSVVNSSTVVVSIIDGKIVKQSRRTCSIRTQKIRWAFLKSLLFIVTTSLSGGRFAIFWNIISPVLNIPKENMVFNTGHSRENKIPEGIFTNMKNSYVLVGSTSLLWTMNAQVFGKIK